VLWGGGGGGGGVVIVGKKIYFLTISQCMVTSLNLLPLVHIILMVEKPDLILCFSLIEGSCVSMFFFFFLFLKLYGLLNLLSHVLFNRRFKY
jgi:hypothetical protein